MTDQFQLLFDDLPAAPVRETWEESAQDAVSAGLAVWVAEEGIFPKAISWSGRHAVIRRRASGAAAGIAPQCGTNFPSDAFFNHVPSSSWRAVDDV
jgi:hypothetical protein